MPKSESRLRKLLAERSPLLVGLFPIAMGLLSIFWMEVAVFPGWDWDGNRSGSWQTPAWAVRLGLSQELVWDIGLWPGRACLVVGIIACICAFWRVRLLAPGVWCLLAGVVMPVWYRIVTF